MNLGKAHLIEKSQKSYRVARPKQTGFSSPATHYTEPRVDLNSALIKNAASTFFIRVMDDGFATFQIIKDDVLIVDKSLTPKQNQLAVIIKDGEFQIARINLKIFYHNTSLGHYYLRYKISFVIALVDCNSFYASCEQVFRPDLQNKPVVVLSNNDGCIIAANKEAKALTHIPMFQPVFKIEKVLKENNVTCFSSNYTLYADMSQRVMNTLREFSPLVEEYSIDESFVDLSHYPTSELESVAKKIKMSVHKNTGVPVGVGVAKTKSLSKMANKFAKKIPENKGVYVVDTEEKRKYLLRKNKIKDIWGIGRKHTIRVQNTGAENALQFTELPLNWVRKEMTVVGERLWRELNNFPCHSMVENIDRKKGIGTAKSFGYKLTDYSLIEEATSYYVAEVADLLRQQSSAANYLEVFLQTNYHSDRDKQYYQKTIITLDCPTNSTIKLTQEAIKGLKKIFKPGFRYKKVGVNLFGLVPDTKIQANLFYQQQKSESKKLTNVIDLLNGKFGKNKVKLASVGNRESKWALIKEHRSPRYTTQWDELLTIGKQ